MAKVSVDFSKQGNSTGYLGANGLNLTEAQHVILVEPQLHQSVEFQAIARVRRLGQKYNTYVYRVRIEHLSLADVHRFDLFVVHH